MTDSSGDATLEKSYTPFGEVLSESGTGESIYGYTGEVTDKSGLVYLRARYYLPGSGRFPTRDQWYGEYSMPLSMNRWVYTNNSPIIFGDPSGKKICLYNTESLCVSNNQELLEVLGRTVPIHLAPGNYWVYTDVFIGPWGYEHSAISADFVRNFNKEKFYTDSCNIKHKILDRDVYITDKVIDFEDLNYLIMVMSHEAGHTWFEYLRENSINYPTAIYPLDLELIEEIYINYVLLDSPKIDDSNKTILKSMNRKHFNITGVLSKDKVEEVLELWYVDIPPLWLISSIY